MKKKMIIDLIMNIVIVLSVAIGMPIHIISGASTGLDGDGLEALRYFTNQSNIFCALVALVVVIIELRMLIKKDIKELPNILMNFRQIAAGAVAITFVTVGFIFLPILGFDFEYLYSGQRILTHFTTPILGIISLIFFANGKTFNWKMNFLAIIPEFIYGIIYDIEVPFTGNWPDFYGFTLGGKRYAPFIVIPLICGMAYLFSFLISLAHKKIFKKYINV